MEKKIFSFELKTRCLEVKHMFLILFTFLLSCWGGNAQTYCVPQYSSGCSVGDDLNSFVLTGHGASVLSDLNSGCTNTDGTGYSNRSSLFTPVDLLPGGIYTVEINTTYSPGYEYASIWIDFNNDGVYDDVTEKLLTGLSLNQSPSFSTGTIDIPLTATSGIRRMRVRAVYGNGTFDACSSQSWGETHDYSVNILSLTPCSGPVVAGTATSTGTGICPSKSFTLGLNGSTVGSGITYQWQSSPAGLNTFTDIAGAVNANHNVPFITGDTDFRCIVTCTNSNSVDTSTVVSTVLLPVNQCYCIPTYSYACSSTSENINSFVLVGEGTSNITDLNTGCSLGNYDNRISSFSPVDLLQDGAYIVQLNTNYSSGSSVWANLWIDFDDNGVFDPTERLISDLPMATTPAFVSPTIVIPASASPGVHRMRVRSNYSGSVDACANGSWGEAHDYEVNIIAVTCYRPTIASVTKASATSVNVTLNASPLNTGTVTYEYEVRTSGQPGSGGAGLVTTGTTSNLNFVISGLQAGLVYTVYVRTDCGSNDFSQYSFYEFGIPASLPYTQDFESAQTGWILSNGGATNEWHVGNAVSSGGNRSLYITNDQGSSNAYTISSATVVHAYKDFELLTGTTDISIAFDWRALAESCCDYIRVWMVPTSFTPSAGTQIAAATGRVNITNNLNMDANFKTFQAIRSATAYTGTFRVVFEWRNDGSVGTMPPGAIDNIEIKRVTCYQPTNVVLSNIKHNGVTVTVTPDSKNTSTVTYEYEVRTSGTAGSGANGLVTSGTSPNTTFNITSLPPDTDLQVYVRTSCGSSDKSFWNSGDFRTLEVLDTVMVKADIDCYDADNGSIDFTTTGGKTPYVYTWTPPVSTSESAANLTPGVYVIVIEDDSGQVINNTVTIYEPPQIISNLDVVNISCNGQNNGSASVSPNGGVTPYTAIWSDNTIGFTNNNLAPGAYSVTIRDANGCPLTEHFVIDDPAVLASSIDTLTHVSVYGGSDGSVTLDVTGGTQPYTYDWTPLVSTSDSASGLTAGTYTVVITDANGCSVTQVVDITEPLPPFEIHLVSLDDVSCNGSNDGSIVVNVIGPNPPFTYSWSPSGGNGTTASNLTSGTYTLTVVDATNEQISETFTIDEPAAMTVSVSNIIDVTCNGSSNGSATASVVGGVAPYTYTWSNGESTPTAVSLSAGTHYVLITDANGCQMQAPFSINQPSPMVINVANITDVSCNGLSDGAITIAVNGGLTPYTYQWNNNQTTANIDNLAAGSYNVIVTDANGCTQTRTFSLADPAFVHPPSAVNQSFCQDSAPDLTAVVVNGTNIKWYDAATGGNLLASSTQLVNGMTYYASQTVGTCESSVRTPVQVTLHSAAPLTSSSKTVCANTVVQDVTIDGYNYMQLKWYTDATTPVALSPTTLLSSTTYYVSTFTNGVCESNRLPVNVVVMPHVPAPVVSPQQVCGSGNQLNDLNVGTTSGATLVWFATAQGTTPLPGTTQALSGTYYVEQMIGTCKSVRVAVPVQVIPVSAPMLTDLAICEGTTIEEFNQQIAPNKYVWYTSNSASTALPETTLITSGTYYIAEDNSGCISNRAIVNVVVNPRPNRPTGPAIQTFSNFATVGDLFANPQGVRWFSTEQDALTHNNQLPSNAPLIDYKKYYGVVVGANNCVSFPLEVTARILTVSNDSFDLT